jgi:hypothetical protein
MAATYVSSVQRLRRLPAVFSGRDLTVKFQWSAATASQYLANWRRASLIRALGGHSDVFMNLIVAPQPDVEQALLRALPEAVRIGVDVLREAGWTTQVQRMPDIAVLAGGPRYKLADFNLQSRTAAWFTRVKPGLTQTGHGVARLAPAWALADMMDRYLDKRVKGAWLLAPDDLELDEAAAADDTLSAFSAFGLDPAFLTAAGYAHVYDSRSDAHL